MDKKPEQKPCKKCGEVKPLKDFPPCKTMNDGTYNVCRKCTKKRNDERRSLLTDNDEFFNPNTPAF